MIWKYTIYDDSSELDLESAKSTPLGRSVRVFLRRLTRETNSCRVGSTFGLQPNYRQVTGKTGVLCLPVFAPCWWMHLLLLLLPSFTASEPHVFDLLTWIKDQKLSRNPPDFQWQLETAETSSLLDCSATGFSTQIMYLHLSYSIISRWSNTTYVTCKYSVYDVNTCNI